MIERVCALHKSRLSETIDPMRDTSGLYCETGGHKCHVWLVRAGNRYVARATHFADWMGRLAHVELAEDYFEGMRDAYDALMDWAAVRKLSYQRTETSILGDVVAWTDASELPRVPVKVVSTKRCVRCGRKCVRHYMTRAKFVRCNRCREEMRKAA